MANDPVVTEIKSAAEIRAESQTPAAFNSAIAGIKQPSADEEAQIRQLLNGKTLDDLDSPVEVPAPSGQPVTTQEVQAPVNAEPVTEVPKKFQKPDGTVDEEKLKTSYENLKQVTEQKQKSIDEMLAEYKEMEKKLPELGRQAKELQGTPPNPISNAQAPSQGIDPQFEQVRQHLLELQRQDPIAFAVEIAKAVSRKEASDIAAPALQVAERLAEQQKDSAMRSNLANLAEKDNRVMNPQLYSELINELNSDPAYFRLKNPMKAAWNEVKERLRLGEPSMAQAQPSQTPGPTLGRGAPPSVSSLSQPMTPSSLFQQAQTINPLSETGKELEEKLLKELANQVWRQ